MSMNSCFKCFDQYDTDFNLEEDVSGNMICNKCHELEAELIDRMAERIHKAYCQYQIDANREPYWTKGDYSKLDERTKEIDRYTARAALKYLISAGYFHKDDVMRVKIHK